MRRIILGTRGSELALTQARMTQAALEQKWPGLEVELKIIKTTGDLRPDIKLAEFQRGPNPVDKGIFTKELEEALRAGEVDVAVHSLKDVPTELAEGFRIAATLERARTEDVLVSRCAGGLAGLPQGALVATSSVRRARLLQHQRPDLRVTEIRGNVMTRLEKLAASSEFSATMLALAGLERLGLMAETREIGGEILHFSVLPHAAFLPAASQGAVGLEVWGENPFRDRLLAGINHGATFAATQVERAFLHLLQAGCHTPVGIWSEPSSHADAPWNLSAIVFPESGGAPRSAAVSVQMDRPEVAAEALFVALS